MDPFTCFGNHFTPGSESECFGGTVFHACRDFTFCYPVEAHVAFHDLRIGAVVFEFRNIERTGYHAISATHAFFLSPDHRPLIRFMHGIGKAG